MRRMRFYDKEKNNQTLSTLANALGSRKQTNINTGGITASGSAQNNKQDDTLQGAVQFGRGLANLYSQGKQKGWFDFGSNTNTGSGSLGSSLDTSLGSNEGLSFLRNGAGNNIDNLSFLNSGSSMGGGGIDSLSFSNLGSSANAGSGSGFSFGGFGGGNGGGFSFGGGSGGGTPWGLIGKTAKSGYNFISDKDDSDYSDLEQSTIYPLQGASAGAQFGPWGALGGALYGLGYSFKDDIGLKDNNWFTDLVFPIGMGDEHQGLIQI